MEDPMLARQYGVATTLFLAAALPVAAAAGDISAPPSSVLYSEMNFARRDQDYYTTFITAFNRDLTKNGVLFRAEGAYNAYNYQNASDARTNADLWQGAALLGYQLVRGDISISGYVGFDYQSVRLSPNDVSNPVRGGEAGVKVIGDIETEKEAPFYLNATAEYSSAFETYFARFRYGRKLGGENPDLRIAVGLEGGLLGDKTTDAQRLGAFAMVPLALPSFGVVDVIVAGGYQWVAERDGGSGSGPAGGPGPYGTISFSFAF
jgi:hypothetical protein